MERRVLARLVMWSLPFIVILATLFVWLSSGRYVSTDNAYVKGDRAQIATELSGIIVEVPVQENQHVSRGQLLFKLDDQSYRHALARIDSEIETARADIRGLRAQWRTKREEIKAASSQLNFAQAEFDRQSDLAEKKIASTQKLQETRMGWRWRVSVSRRPRRICAYRGPACRRSQDPSRRSSQGQTTDGRPR
jgi:membrane fusion protein (multidrug efflux system)